MPDIMEMVKKIKLAAKLVSCMEKVFPNEEPPALDTPVSLLKDDFAAFQLAVQPISGRFVSCEIEIESPIAQWITVRQVENMPVRCISPSTEDGDYISGQPGLYPDLLKPSRAGGAYGLLGDQWNTFWFEVETTADTPAGDHPVHISLKTKIFDKEGPAASIDLTVTVVNAVLPKQTLKRTEWFYADCVADYYHVEPWSEQHWQLMEDQMAFAGRRGVNMILTPLFTYPLDTDRRAERTTVQLMDVMVRCGSYSFGFNKFRRFVEMAKRCGMEYFEMSHLFTQGGAAGAVKVMADEDGEYRQIFGPDDPSNGKPFQAFLAALLPALTAVIDELGIRGKVVFHISDEPQLEHLPLYKELKEKLSPYLEGFAVIDALSDYDFYQQGVCEHPVVASNHVTPFLEGETPEDFWVYYCVGQFYQVSNRYIAMPSSRNRIIAEQLYKYQVKGFLQWGYNFYNSVGSLYHINPFASTDSDGGFPAGDAFSVYPGDDGKPWPSIRLEIFWQAMCDLRAFSLLESLAGRDFVMGLIESEGEVTFFEYPRNAGYHLRLRQRVNEEIAKRV